MSEALHWGAARADKPTSGSRSCRLSAQHELKQTQGSLQTLAAQGGPRGSLGMFMGMQS